MRIHEGHMAACADKMSNVICLQHAAKLNTSVLHVWSGNYSARTHTAALTPQSDWQTPYIYLPESHREC